MGNQRSGNQRRNSNEDVVPISFYAKGGVKRPPAGRGRSEQFKMTPHLRTPQGTKPGDE